MVRGCGGEMAIGEEGGAGSWAVERLAGGRWGGRRKVWAEQQVCWYHRFAHAALYIAASGAGDIGSLSLKKKLSAASFMTSPLSGQRGEARPQKIGDMMAMAAGGDTPNGGTPNLLSNRWSHNDRGFRALALSPEEPADSGIVEVKPALECASPAARPSRRGCATSTGCGPGRSGLLPCGTAHTASARAGAQP